MSFGFSQSRRINRTEEDSDASDLSGIPSGIETGAILRERREAMGVTLEEAEASIRIRQKYLAAMEADEWHLLPGEIVGRGFLRNYAAFLDLEPSELLERRHSAIEPRLAAALRSTSAGAALPPTRAVDYDPKELDLKDEPEGIEGSSFNFRGLIPILALLVFAYLVWQGFDRIVTFTGAISDGVQNRIEDFRADSAPPTVGDIVANNESTVESSNRENTDTDSGGVAIQADTSAVSNGSGSSGNGDSSSTDSSDNSSDPIASGDVAPTPTPEPPTPTPEPPTPTAEPPTSTPQPPTPIPEPPTPIPEPPTPEPVVVLPVCPDPRSIITAPGENQIISGAVDVTGSATHEAFQFYKLEYAPGANASQGWAYFDGGNNQVAQGRLGTMDTRSLANGVYSMRLVVVDLTANFPPPCQVTFTIQN